MCRYKTNIFVSLSSRFWVIDTGLFLQRLQHKIIFDIHGVSIDHFPFNTRKRGKVGTIKNKSGNGQISKKKCLMRSKVASLLALVVAFRGRLHSFNY